MLAHVLFVTICALAYAELIRRRKYKPPKGLKLPPGPQGKPIVGHFFQLSEFLQPRCMSEWKEKYGDIVSINSFGIPIIFLYDDDIARELLEKRGATNSDRPDYEMANQVGWDFNFALYHYGDLWRRHRKAMQLCFNSRAVTVFEPIQIKSCRLLLQDLLETPADFSQHITFCISKIILDAVYAIEVQKQNDPLIHVVHFAMEGIGQVLVPGEWLMDVFPILKHIPHWIPGITANKFIKRYRQATLDSLNIPFNIVKNRKEPDYSFVSKSLQNLRNSGDTSSDGETIIKNTAGVAYAAGAGTSATAALQAIIASLLYPEKQRNMQEELDRVLGDRLPTLADRASLPYVNAFCYEVLRWRPNVPLGSAHATLEESTYGGYFIPKGSFIFATSWQILRNSKYGPNPEDFIPERFLQPGARLPSAQFGYGRRICSGRFFAENTLFLLIASILKVFDISPMKDEHGIDIPFSEELTGSFLPFPGPFQCSITPRSPRAKDLIFAQDV